MAAVQTRHLIRGGAAVLLATAIAVLAGGAAAQPAVRRIISIVPATTEMLFAMGAGDRLVAVGSYDRFPPDVERLPKVGALLDPNIEHMLTLRPDLVVMYGTQVELKQQLERANIPYYAYNPGGLADITGTIRSLGLRVGAGPTAAALAGRVDQELADIRTRVAPHGRPSTLLVFGRERRSLRNIDASGGIGFLHDMLESAGGADVLADMKRQSVLMSTEMVLARAPEIIIELRYSRDDDPGAEQDLQAWNRLGSVPAVRNHRVYLLRGEEFVVPGPRVGLATERLARAIHPEAFK